MTRMPTSPPPGSRRPAPPRAPPPKRPQLIRVDHVLADIRDRLHATPDSAAEHPLAGFVDASQVLVDECRAAGNEPLHFDATVACSFRESMLALARIATRAVVEHDRRAIAARKSGAA